jgi:hypothetical protein
MMSDIRSYVRPGDQGSKEYCSQVYNTFGYGLHAVQDIDAHWVLTPAEHNHYEVYDGRVINQTMAPDWPGAIRGRFVHRTPLRTGPGNFLPGWYFRVGCGFQDPFVRVWEWPDAAPARPRLDETEQKTRPLLLELLHVLLSAGGVCTKCVSQLPPRKTCNEI